MAFRAEESLFSRAGLRVGKVQIKGAERACELDLACRFPAKPATRLTVSITAAAPASRMAVAATEGGEESDEVAVPTIPEGLGVRPGGPRLSIAA